MLNNISKACTRFARLVFGLWASGFFGSAVGAGFGVIVALLFGAVSEVTSGEGSVLDFAFSAPLAVIAGAIIGSFAGFPAAVVGSVLGTRQGWRLGGGLAVLLIAFTFTHYVVSHGGYIPLWAALFLAVTAQLGFWSGGVVWSRLETGDGFWDKWRCLLEHRGLNHLEGLRILYIIAGLAPLLLAEYFVLFFRISPAAR